MKTRGQRIGVEVYVWSELATGLEPDCEKKVVKWNGQITFRHTNGSRLVEVNLLALGGGDLYDQVFSAMFNKTDVLSTVNPSGIYRIVHLEPQKGKMIVSIADPESSFTEFVVKMITAFRGRGYCSSMNPSLRTNDWRPRDIIWEINTPDGWFTHEKWIEHQIYKQTDQ